MYGGRRHRDVRAGAPGLSGRSAWDVGLLLVLEAAHSELLRLPIVADGGEEGPRDVHPRPFVAFLANLDGEPSSSVSINGSPSLGRPSESSQPPEIYGPATFTA